MQSWRRYIYLLVASFLLALFLSLEFSKGGSAQNTSPENQASALSQENICKQVNLEDFRNQTKPITLDIDPAQIEIGTSVIPDGENIEIAIVGIEAEELAACASISDKEVRILNINRAPDNKINLTLAIPSIGWKFLGKRDELEIVFLPFNSNIPQAQVLSERTYYLSKDIAISSWLFSFIGSLGVVAIIYIITSYIVLPSDASQTLFNNSTYLSKFNFKRFDPVVIASGKFGRASLVNLQVLWFSVVVFGLLVHVFLRTGALSPISEDILLLLGISAAGKTFSSSVETARNKLSIENLSWLRNQGWLVSVDRKKTAKWHDLVVSDDSFDVYKYQLLIFSFLIGITLTVSGLNVLGTFKLPTGFLSLLGLSNVVYIFGLTVSQNSISELNEQLNNLRELEKNYQEKSSEYLYKARNIARMLVLACGQDVTKFKDEIQDVDLIPTWVSKESDEIIET